MKHLLFLFALANPLAHADDCKAVMAATKKAAVTPNHLYITQTSAARNGGKPTNSEVITTADHRYVLVNGTWNARAYNPTQEAADMDAAESKPTCSAAPDDTVDGDAASVYSEKTDDATSQIWISKKSGLPLRLTTDIDVGGKAGKSHSETRFDYKNVTPPAI